VFEEDKDLIPEATVVPDAPGQKNGVEETADKRNRFRSEFHFEV
jgi:hypothetical protein